MKIEIGSIKLEDVVKLELISDGEKGACLEARLNTGPSQTILHFHSKGTVTKPRLAAEVGFEQDANYRLKIM